jgi:hypothetical protein
VSNLPAFVSCICGGRQLAPYFCYHCRVSIGTPNCENCGRPISIAKVFDCPNCNPASGKERAEQIRRECSRPLDCEAYRRPVPISSVPSQSNGSAAFLLRPEAFVDFWEYEGGKVVKKKTYGFNRKASKD